ncbi:hypothetical protein AQJ91_05535 [Streptomyces dysideae]|uniref:Uncharacterized protein n=1 Tax=Streptomyces dysideae TaxID=909626 RepID=A0A101V3X0_9ACTN|nr:hypothetical protein AQJ91_05535 [Streptomyces dysideae]
MRAAYAETAARLDLIGPEEGRDVIPVSSYKVSELAYEVQLDVREGTVDTDVKVETDAIYLTMDIEALALALNVVEKRGGFSHSARNLKQLKKSLTGQVGYVELLHPMLSGGEAEKVMVQAGARRWR